MSRIALNDTPFEGQSRSFTCSDGRERVTCKACGSILDARFEGRRSMTVLGSSTTSTCTAAAVAVAGRYAGRPPLPELFLTRSTPDRV
jgi:hypothetical protein